MTRAEQRPGEATLPPSPTRHPGPVPGSRSLAHHQRRSGREAGPLIESGVTVQVGRGGGPRTRRAQAGFTLVEVMVSVLIFGMLAAAGVAILSFSVRAQGATAAKLDDLSALNRTIALVLGDLAQARPRATRDTEGLVVPAFVGTASGVPLVRFVRAGWSNIDAAPRASTQKVEYRLVEGRLERLSYPMLDGAAPLPAVALLTKVRAVSARYRYKGAWADRWDGSNGVPLPDAIEIAIVRDTGVAYRAVALVGSGYVPDEKPKAANAAP